MYSVVQYMFVAGNYMNSNYMFIKDQILYISRALKMVSPKKAKTLEGLFY
ncbi:unnamed protein product [Prunus brigantina]